MWKYLAELCKVKYVLKIRFFFSDYYLPCLLQFSKRETSQNAKWLKKEREINWWNHPTLELLKSWWLIFGIFQYISKTNFNTNTFKLFIQISIILLMVYECSFILLKYFQCNQVPSLCLVLCVCTGLGRYIYKVKILVINNILVNKTKPSKY